MFRSVSLEMSLKPFKQTDEAYIREVCRRVFTDWRPLLKDRESISIMLWASDGSQILDYTGDLDRAFEWACYVGTANLPLIAEGEDQGISLHAKKRYYMEKPPVMTYRILKNIVSILKEEGKKAFPNSEIRIGETFDIGPEFAISDFKYERHPEICSGTMLDCHLNFVDSSSSLHADSYPYAAYPDGIPEGLSFAGFFGAQVKAFFADMGFDYIWLSNGLGFSADPWSLTGKIFDGERFYADKLERTSDKVFSFWRLFREACPDVPIETRGTNNSAGIDYATDGVPLWDIYRANFNIVPPPNSPWAALNDNYGLELMGHMSRIAELPGKDFLFRYYIHDPWWMNSPWYDRYDGYANDIYLPMSVCRIDENGGVQSAERFHILSIDNSKGNMPQACVCEPMPHILKAEKDIADEPSFLIWLYPVKEYTTAKREDQLSEMYYADKFIMEAINHGLPLNCVVSTENFQKISAEVYRNRILVTPVIENDEVNALLGKFLADGGKLVVYGSRSKLASCPLVALGACAINMEGDPSALRESLAAFGYDIRFETREGYLKLPAMTTVRHNNALVFSVYNPDTTTHTLMKFPLGAPILSGGEAEMVDGYAKYTFSRCEHRECRVFVRQKDGVVSMHEEPPGSVKYRRRCYLRGLRDATVYYFPEKYCDKYVAVTQNRLGETPELEDGWTPIYDEIMGHGFKKEGVNGKISFHMPFKEFVQ